MDHRLVTSQSGFAAEGTAAVLAGEDASARVVSFVTFQIGRREERFAAAFAGERTFQRVSRSLVAIQVE